MHSTRFLCAQRQQPCSEDWEVSVHADKFNHCLALKCQRMRLNSVSFFFNFLKSRLNSRAFLGCNSSYLAVRLMALRGSCQGVVLAVVTVYIAVHNNNGTQQHCLCL